MEKESSHTSCYIASATPDFTTVYDNEGFFGVCFNIF